jgi:hypothetical protein
MARELEFTSAHQKNSSSALEKLDNSMSEKGIRMEQALAGLRAQALKQESLEGALRQLREALPGLKDELVDKRELER